MGDLMDGSVREQAAKMKWFHALDLGAFQTSGRFPPGTPQNRTLFPVMDLLQRVDFNGLDCLDIGTAHGLSAFGMKLRGAGSVTATDVMEERSPPWELARTALDLDIEYVEATTFENILTRLAGRKFDIIVCAGVIYHMFNPFDAILKCRRLLKPNGLFLLESAYISTEERAILDFNPASEALKEVYTYWMPSRSAMLGMLRLTGFDPLADRAITKPDRLAILSKNVAWAEVRQRSPLTVRMHDIGIYATDAQNEPQGEPSTAQYSAQEDSMHLDWNAYVPDWPPHPKAMTDVVGKTTWMSKTKTTNWSKRLSDDPQFLRRQFQLDPVAGGAGFRLCNHVRKLRRIIIAANDPAGLHPLLPEADILPHPGILVHGVDENDIDLAMRPITAGAVAAKRNDIRNVAHKMQKLRIGITAQIDKIMADARIFLRHPLPLIQGVDRRLRAERPGARGLAHPGADLDNGAAFGNRGRKLGHDDQIGRSHPSGNDAISWRHLGAFSFHYARPRGERLAAPRLPA